MNRNDYNCSFTVDNSPAEVFDAVCKVSDWWTANIDGKAKKLNDVFTIHFGETYVTFKVVEMIAGKKIAWNVMDCYLHWIADKKEWKDTTLDFEITGTQQGTAISVTHIGLVPGIECYENCKKGWDFYAGESLQKLITQGKGKPDTSQTNR